MSLKEIEINFSVNDKKEIVQEDLGAKHSLKIISFLKSAAKEYNSSFANKTSAEQLKKVFVHAIQIAKNFQEKCDLNEYASARVFMFLRLKEGKEAPVIGANVILASGEIDATNGWLPSISDFEKAKKAIKDFELDYPFEDENDLYLENENQNSRNWIEII